MNNKSFLFILLFNIFICFYCNCQKNSSYEVPIIKGAFQIKNCSKYKAIKCVEYKVELPYLSMAALDYYDENLRRKGWISFIEDYYSKGNREWIISPSANRSLTAYWVDSKKTKRITVVLLQGKKEMGQNTLSKESTSCIQTIIYEERAYYELPPFPNY